MDKEPANKIRQARLLLSRLERIPVDSEWSHRASGIRAALAKTLNRIKTKPEEEGLDQLQDLLQAGYGIAEGAARELPD